MADKVINGSLDVTGAISQNGHSIAPQISVTWAELKTLRDGGTLVPGQQYRITDYVCTTIQTNTSSAGHQFDIIVAADSADKLNEVASACLHEGDTYFANNKLEAWKLWYCLDNDTNKFAWAQVAMEEHLVYNNMSCFRDPQYDGVNGNYCWHGQGMNYFFTDTLDAPSVGSMWILMNNTWAKMIDSASVQYFPASVEGKGVIYRMIDEFNNDIPYDFKNILFTDSAETPKYTNAYTFSYTGSGTVQDASLSLSNGCYGNSMKEYLLERKQQLSFNVFYSSGVSSSFRCYYNAFGYNCHSNTFGNGCYSNTFGNSCSDNTFGNSYTLNTFGNEAYLNTFGNSCSSNTFGNGCNHNTFGDYCNVNTFGTSCYDNTFGDGYESNRFGDYCSSNTFGDYCTSNTLVGNCSRNIFGSDCIYNTIGKTCRFNTFGDYCSYNTFGNGCTYNTFGDSSSSINYCKDVLLDNDCKYLYIISTDTSATSNNYLQNVHVHLGVSGSSSSNRKTITVPDRNLAYETNFVVDGTNNIIV